MNCMDELFIENMGAVVRGNMKKILYKSISYITGIVLFLIFQFFIIVIIFLHFDYKYENKINKINYKIDNIINNK